LQGANVLNSDLENKDPIDYPKRNVWIKTFGCQMNYHDTERVLSHLRKLNFLPTDDKNDADLLLFNTCAVRALANMKFYSQLGELKVLKKQKKSNIVIGVLGCISQIEGQELLKKYKHLDFALGTDMVDQIPEVLYRIYSGESKIVLDSFDKTSAYSIETKITHQSPQAFINIMKGCNNFCTYCIVPYTRGREKSRLIKEVVADIQRLVEHNGIAEVTLLGQNVNSFGKENQETFPELLARVNQIAGLRLIRYTTSHPKDLSDELINAHGTLSKLALHLHLPVQSGSNTVLARMNRKYTREAYLDLLARLRDKQKGIVISSDIIVGFPGETDEEYEDTIDLLKQARFDFIFSFKFSKRPGTQAYLMEDHPDDQIKSKRLKKLQDLQLAIQNEIRQEMVGKTMQLLVDGVGKIEGKKKWKGRSSCNRIVHFDGPPEQSVPLLYKWVTVKITSSTALSAQGEFISIC